MVAAYLVVTLGWGVWHARRASQGIEEFFVAGRSLPWGLAGTSLVATTFAVDTPLAVAGLVATEGIAGNWFWWADVLPAMIAAFWIAHLWRRSGVLTDNELVELRYSGAPARWLRLIRALYFGVLRNAIVIGWVNLAMLKLLGLALDLDAASSGLVLLGLFALTVVYTLAAGLWGVVLTDALQFGLALAGAIALAFFALDAAGGLGALRSDLVAALRKVEDAPWGEWGKSGQGLTTHSLARLLKPFQIKPALSREGESVGRRYTRKGFEDAWTRYGSSDSG